MEPHANPQTTVLKRIWGWFKERWRELAAFAGFLKRPWVRCVIYALIMCGVLYIHYYRTYPMRDRGGLQESDIVNWREFCTAVWSRRGSDGEPSPGGRIWELLPEEAQSRMAEFVDRNEETPSDGEKEAILEGLNGLMLRRDFYRPQHFAKVECGQVVEVFSTGTQLALLARQIRVVNESILHAAFPQWVKAPPPGVVVDDADGRAIWATIAFAVTILLAVVAVEVSVRHSRSLDRVQSILTDTFGLSGYVDAAARIYAEAGTDRVVTSLQHWVATDELGGKIERGLRRSDADKIYFVGHIAKGRHFIGVMWRFVMLRRAVMLGKTIRLIHTDPGIPLFVVTRRRNARMTEEDRGSLLVGNPKHTEAETMYGFSLGHDNPRQVDHYNFVFDTLIRLAREDEREFRKEVETRTHVRPYGSSDGLSHIFRAIPPFNDLGGSLYTRHPEDPDRPEESHREMIAQGLIRDTGANESFPDSEKQLQLTGNEIQKIATEFLLALERANILQFQPNDKGIRYMLAGRFSLGSESLPSCEDFFKKQERDREGDQRV